jgi:CO/xanthine dehydrogenase Mo-binding subunit
MSEDGGILSRRDLLKTGGVLVVGFSLAGVPVRAAPAAGGQVAGPPDPNTVDSWLAIHGDNTATVYLGKCELGQGNTTGLLQIVGEELDMDMTQLSAVRLDTNVTPDQGATSASSSIHRGGPPLRAAAAEARQTLMQLASARLGEQPGSLVVSKGVVSVEGQPARSITYGALLGDKPFNVKMTGTAPVKPPSRYALVGQSVPRIDIPEKAGGTYVRIQNVRVPGMLHGRIVLPKGQRAYGSAAKVVSVDESSIAHIPGARVIRKRDFIGVVAEREWDAVKAARDLKVVWAEPPRLPRSEDVYEAMRKAKTTDTVIADYGNPAEVFERAAHTVAGTYYGPYQGHIPFSPNCAIADVKADGALIQSGTQNVYASRAELAAVLGTPVEKVRVQYFESSGTFGRSCYEDAAQAAALLSQAVRRPVRVQFMRWDEHGWDNYGPPHIADVRAAIDAQGNLVAYEYHGWQHGWTTRATVHDLALGVITPERDSGSNSITVNPISTGSMYKVANRRVISHAVPMQGLLRGAALRSPLDLNYGFASEQTIDQLAYLAKIDPLEFRRKNIAQSRWLDVLNAAAAAAGWTPRVAASALSDAEIVTGRGIGIATHHVSYGAAVAEVEVNKATGNIAVKRLYGALDCGCAINPGLVENQIVGQMVQTVSRMLKEEVLFDQRGVTSLDWASYPILRFAEAPDVVPIVVQRIDEPSTGAGEEVMGAAAAAIANAVFDATGVRLHRYPMTPDRVKQALAAAEQSSAARG